MKSAMLILGMLLFWLFSATASAQSSGDPGTSAPGWPQTVTAGNSPFNLPAVNGLARTVTVTDPDGSIKIDCLANGKIKMTVRPGTDFQLDGPSGTSFNWSDTTIDMAENCNGNITGDGSTVNMNGNSSTLTIAGSGSSVKSMGDNCEVTISGDNSVVSSTSGSDNLKVNITGQNSSLDLKGDDGRITLINGGPNAGKIDVQSTASRNEGSVDTDNVSIQFHGSDGTNVFTRPGGTDQG